MQNLRVSNKEHYGMLWYFLEWSIVFRGKLHVARVLVVIYVLISFLRDRKKKNAGDVCLKKEYLYGLVERLVHLYLRTMFGSSI